jgi:hypothetical protein
MIENFPQTSSEYFLTARIAFRPSGSSMIKEALPSYLSRFVALDTPLRRLARSAGLADRNLGTAPDSGNDLEP